MKKARKKVSKKVATVTRKKVRQVVYFKCPQCSTFMKKSQASTHVCRPLQDGDLREICEPEIHEAWLKLKNLALELGEQRHYSSTKALMFSKSRCYMFVRPKKNRLELSLFLNRKLDSELVKKILEPSGNRFCHVIHITHEDLIEYPLTEWISEAYAEAGSQTEKCL